MQSQRPRRFSPVLKRIVMAVLLKKAFDKVQEMRQPAKPSPMARVAKVGMIGGTGGGLLYMLASGKLKPMIDKVMGKSTDPSTSWNPSQSGSGGSVTT
jgi:hypothetical protein